MNEPGKTSLIVHINSYWDFGNDISTTEYKNEKEKSSSLVESILLYLYPEIECRDIATPITYYRYTGVKKGAYIGWFKPPKSSNKLLPKKIKGINNLYLAGMWTEMIEGIPSALISGRDAVYIMSSKQRSGDE